MQVIDKLISNHCTIIKISKKRRKKHRFICHTTIDQVHFEQYTDTYKNHSEYSKLFGFKITRVIIVKTKQKNFDRERILTYIFIGSGNSLCRFVETEEVFGVKYQHHQ